MADDTRPARPDPIWIIMPVLSDQEKTEAALADCLAQSVPVRVLVVNQGVDPTFRLRLEKIAESEPDRVFLWHHLPPLPSLAATWNRALEFVWRTSTGSVEEWCAFVVNNDVRLHRETLEWLQRIARREQALFVSAVGVTEPQFIDSRSKSYSTYDFWDAHAGHGELLHKGGPDFSCFLITYEGHDRFKFDERFVPAFCEDLDYHRRLMLAGEGKRIFSVNLPYLHYGSNTLKSLPPDEAQGIRALIERGSRAYYAEKWGGPVNQETYLTPFSKEPLEHVTTPELQARDAGEPVKSWALSDKERAALEFLGEEPERNAAGQVIRRTAQNAAGQMYLSPPPIDELSRRMMARAEPQANFYPPSRYGDKYSREESHGQGASSGGAVPEQRDHPAQSDPGPDPRD